MGACLGKTEEEGNPSSASAAGGDSKKNTQSVHSVMLRHRNIDVFQKYETIEVLGQGSMGAVSKVRVKEGQEGGSAFNPNPKAKKGMAKQSSSVSLSERRHNKVNYALKQIQLDKVSSVFLEELHNEIDILKTMVRGIFCSIRFGFFIGSVEAEIQIFVLQTCRITLTL